MTTYVVFENRKKYHHETLAQFYESITYGTVEASTPYKAIPLGASTFNVRQSLIDVVSFKRAPIFQQQELKKRSR